MVSDATDRLRKGESLESVLPKEMVSLTPEQAAEAVKDYIKKHGPIGDPNYVKIPTDEEMKQAILNGIMYDSDKLVDGFIPKPNERDKYHVILDKHKFDPDNGDKISVAIPQIFEKEEWPMIEADLKRQGFKITMLWNPNK